MNFQKVIEQYFPKKYAMENDINGWTLKLNNNFSKKLVVLEITEKVVNYAIENKVNLIITHHPSIFKSINQINITKSYKEKLIIKLIQANINVYNAHTNADFSPKGLNYYFANKVFENKFAKYSSLLKTDKDDLLGIKLVVNMNKKQFLENNNIKKHCSEFKVIGQIPDQINTIGIMLGTGSSFRKIKDVDIYLTGDIYYHDAVDIIQEGKCAIDIGHFSENIFCDLIEEILSNEKIKIINGKKLNNTPYENKEEK